MTQSAIIQSINALREQLDSSQMLSPDEQTAISSLEAEIEQILYKQSFDKDSNQDPEAYLLSRFEDKLLSFEQEHPSFASVIRKISNSLSNIGV